MHVPCTEYLTPYCPAIHCLVLSSPCPALPCLVFSCPVYPCPFLSCLVLPLTSAGEPAVPRLPGLQRPPRPPRPRQGGGASRPRHLLHPLPGHRGPLPGAAPHTGGVPGRQGLGGGRCGGAVIVNYSCNTQYS